VIAKQYSYNNGSLPAFSQARYFKDVVAKVAG
jgi:hypothetical protein